MASLYNPGGSSTTSMQINVEKGLIGAAVLGALVLLAPIAKQSKEFVNCVKNSEDAIVKLTGVEFLDKDGKPGFLERPVAVHYCNGGDITNFLMLSALSDCGERNSQLILRTNPSQAF